MQTRCIYDHTMLPQQFLWAVLHCRYTTARKCFTLLSVSHIYRNIFLPRQGWFSMHSRHWTTLHFTNFIAVSEISITTHCIGRILLLVKNNKWTIIPTFYIKDIFLSSTVMVAFSWSPLSFLTPYITEEIFEDKFLMDQISFLCFVCHQTNTEGNMTTKDFMGKHDPNVGSNSHVTEWQRQEYQRWFWVFRFTRTVTESLWMAGMEWLP